MELVNGVGMTTLVESQKTIVMQELDHHLQVMHSLRTSSMGGPSGHVILPSSTSKDLLERLESSELRD